MSLLAVPLAIAWMSVCSVETAKRIKAVVVSSFSLTWITGKTLARALVVLDLAVSSMVIDFAAMTLSSALVTKASVSISTLVSVSVYFLSNSFKVVLSSFSCCI